MNYKNGKTISTIFFITFLSGCSSQSPAIEEDTLTTNKSQQISSLDCDKNDPLNTSYITGGVAGLAALNPLFALLVGGVTYVVTDAINPECQNISKEP